jgi:hypothetical protein
MHICDHRYRRNFTFDGPVQLVCKLNRCPDPLCHGHATTKSPESESRIALPGWIIGWDVFCWIGHRRFARHWSIPQIRGELLDSYAIVLCENSGPAARCDFGDRTARSLSESCRSNPLFDTRGEETAALRGQATKG